VTKLHIEEQMIVSSDGRAVEVFLCRPHEAPPGPGVVIVHGHQLGERSGGRATAESSVFQQWHQRGFLVAAVSQPGYGRSTGPADYAGPGSHPAPQRCRPAASRSRSHAEPLGPCTRA
jgi:pimeloyl-ACP methyl ester carboxylesterase